MRNKLRGQNLKSKIRAILSFMIILLPLIVGCQRVEKPMKGGTGPMAIVIDVDMAPESHTANTTAEGERLVNPYSQIPVIGGIFKSNLEGLDYWRAYHPVLVTGTHNPSLLADQDESCLDCHDPGTSCNNCHSYVGARAITGDME